MKYFIKYFVFSLFVLPVMFGFLWLGNFCADLLTVNWLGVAQGNSRFILKSVTVLLIGSFGLGVTLTCLSSLFEKMAEAIGRAKGF